MNTNPPYTGYSEGHPPYTGYSEGFFSHTTPDGVEGFFQGDWYRGLPHGRGSFLKMADDMKSLRALYEGGFNQGSFHGSGKLMYSGKNFIGHWSNNKLNGRSFKDLLFDFQNYNEGVQEGCNCPIERKTTTFADGSRYEGGYKHGKRYGQGTYTAKNGRRFTGTWIDGYLNGKDVCDFAREASDDLDPEIHNLAKALMQYGKKK